MLSMMISALARTLSSSSTKKSDQSGEVGVQLGDRHRRRSAFLHAERGAVGGVAVGRRPVCGDGVADAGIGQRAGVAGGEPVPGSAFYLKKVFEII